MAVRIGRRRTMAAAGVGGGVVVGADLVGLVSRERERETGWDAGRWVLCRDIDIYVCLYLSRDDLRSREKTLGQQAEV